jgi:hypothetical protein
MNLCARWLVLVASVTAYLAACGSPGNNGPAIPNPKLQRWCDAHPCGWDAPKDSIKRVGSWHPNDYAVELVTDDAELSHFNPDITQAQATCLSFSLVAKVDAGTRVLLELDFLNDGHVEFSTLIPTSDWELRTFTITTPTWYRGVRFIVRKDGPGRAIVAELAADMTLVGCRQPPLALLDRPDGAACDASDQCTSGICSRNVCVECNADSDCGSDQICGAVTVAEPTTDATHARNAWPPLRTRTCVARASASFGSICTAAAQCVTGHCSDGVCSECATDADCPQRQHCGLPSSIQQSLTPGWPSQCAPRLSMGAAGNPCVSDSDCHSGLCTGGSFSCAGTLCATNRNSDPPCLSSCSDWHVTGGTCP